MRGVYKQPFDLFRIPETIEVDHNDYNGQQRLQQQQQASKVQSLNLPCSIGMARSPCKTRFFACHLFREFSEPGKYAKIWIQ